MSTYEQVKEPRKHSKKADYSHFEKNKTLKSSPYTGNVIQGYFPVPNTDYIQSAAPPAQAGNAGPRYIAVHKYEPATIYFSKEIPGGLPRPVREFLDRLGMLSSQVSTVQINGTIYQRYHQTMRQFSPEGNLQTYRTEEEELGANRILDIQKRIILSIEDIFQQASGQADFQRLKERLEGLINIYYESPGRYVKGAVISLGSDILYAAFALLRYIQMKLEDEEAPQTEVYVRVPEVRPGDKDSLRVFPLERLQTQKPDYEPGTVMMMNEPVCNIDTDGPLLLNLIKEEIKIRKNQIDAERALTAFKPVIRTGCDTSAGDLSRIIQKDKNLRFAADFQHSRLRFSKDIGWNWHAASNVPFPVSQLTSDRLVLEDAVGKSFDTEEKANAHWFAHLYGNDETAGTLQIPLITAVLPMEDPGNFQQWTSIPSNCKFNRADLPFRRAFFEVRGLAPDDAWLLIGSNGYMKVHITNEYQVAYNFKSSVANPDIPVIDFTRTTADAVIDDLLVQELAVQAYLRMTGEQPHARSEDIDQVTDENPPTRSENIRDMRKKYLSPSKDFNNFIRVIEEW